MTNEVDDDQYLANMNNPSAGTVDAVDHRLERAISELRDLHKDWRSRKRFGKLGLEIDMESGATIVARTIAVGSIK